MSTALNLSNRSRIIVKVQGSEGRAPRGERERVREVASLRKDQGRRGVVQGAHAKELCLLISGLCELSLSELSDHLENTKQNKNINTYVCDMSGL